MGARAWPMALLFAAALLPVPRGAVAASLWKWTFSGTVEYFERNEGEEEIRSGTGYAPFGGLAVGDRVTATYTFDLDLESTHFDVSLAQARVLGLVSASVASSSFSRAYDPSAVAPHLGSSVQANATTAPFPVRGRVTASFAQPAPFENGHPLDDLTVRVDLNTPGVTRFDLFGFPGVPTLLLPDPTVALAGADRARMYVDFRPLSVSPIPSSVTALVQVDAFSALQVPEPHALALVGWGLALASLRGRARGRSAHPASSR